MVKLNIYVAEKTYEGVTYIIASTRRTEVRSGANLRYYKGIEAFSLKQAKDKAIELFKNRTT